jgi:hypothetical protein
MEKARSSGLFLSKRLPSGLAFKQLTDLPESKAIIIFQHNSQMNGHGIEKL